jgi:phage tail-like protein
MALGPTGVRLDPFPAFNFLVTFVDTSKPEITALNAIQNVVLGGFSECSGLEMTLQVDEHREGGNNGTVRKFPGRVSWSNIRLRRGMTFSDELWNWHYSFVTAKGRRRDGIVLLQNEEQTPVKAWIFRAGLPVRWSGPALDAAQSRVSIEELEIAHEGLELAAPAAGLATASGVPF